MVFLLSKIKNAFSVTHQFVYTMVENKQHYCVCLTKISHVNTHVNQY